MGGDDEKTQSCVGRGEGGYDRSWWKIVYMFKIDCMKFSRK